MKPTPARTFVFANLWMHSTNGKRIQQSFVMVFLSVLAACTLTPRTIPFQNITHRQVYSLDESDLRRVQFFISTDVVAQTQDAKEIKAFFLPRMTPGVVTSAGPNWIKVNFREGGVDVPFITDPKQNNSLYWIASENEGGKDFKKVSEIPGHVFLYKGTSFRLVSGADAYLILDWDSWQEVVETRKVTEGRRVDGN